MTRVLVGLLLCSALVFSAGAALAAPIGPGDNGQANLNLHVGPVLAKGACEAGKLPCASLVTHGDLATPLVGPFYYVYAVVENGSDSTGIGGVEFGVQYDGAVGSGVDIFDWTLCADLEFPMDTPAWPASGSGDLITWDGVSNCQKTPSSPKYSVVAVAGYFYMGAYSNDCLYTTVRPVSGRAKVANCKAFETIIDGKSPSHLGAASFGPAPPCGMGYRPCGAPTPVQKSTWGTIKSIYRG
jgi:hypothetical protein